MSALREIIHENVRGGELYEKLDRNWVRCFACGHCVGGSSDFTAIRGYRIQTASHVPETAIPRTSFVNSGFKFSGRCLQIE